jgi:hypothetical protein
LVVVAGVVVGLLLVFDVVVELPDLPPQPLTATLPARASTTVSMAVGDVFFMGRAPNLTRGLGD